MFTTKDTVHDISDVPAPWIFEHFCRLGKKLNGTDVMIKSIFNDRERTPSMSIYYNTFKNSYRYKDFSTGKGGDAIDLVRELTGLSYHKTCGMIVERYSEFVLHNKCGYDFQKTAETTRYRIDGHGPRPWNTHDQAYWTQFNIGTRLLDEYGVRPLEYYVFRRDNNGQEERVVIRNNYLYGYFRRDGTLYKIYQPKTRDKKFIKLPSDYIQGTEQLKNHRYLVITSSLKDIMAIRSLRIPVDLVAPDSENTLIRPETMKKYIADYQKVIVLFDYDDAGIEAMKRYRELYPAIATCVLTMSKDPADSIRDFGPREVFRRLVPALNNKLES